jgi:membrane protease YdiL (CAAX protease family)
MIKSSESTGSEGAAVVIRWRESLLVLLIVLAPIGLAVLLVVIGVAAPAAWQIVHAAKVELPTPASIRLYGLFSYAVGSWIAVAFAWLWSKREGMQRDVFIFRRLTLPTLAASIVGCAIVTFGVPIVTNWLTNVSSGRGPDVRIDFHDGPSVAIIMFLFVVTTPVSEEVLYRGLLVAWLRRLGWKDFNISVVGSLIFAANHILPLGLVWAAAMILLGAVTYALRLRYNSLSPGWLSHTLFNAQLTLSYPLIAWWLSGLTTLLALLNERRLA